MRNKSEVIENWINRVMEEGIDLTEWEIGFMESIAEQWDKRAWISDRQEEILERIYANKTK